MQAKQPLGRDPVYAVRESADAMPSAPYVVRRLQQDPAHNAS